MTLDPNELADLLDLILEIPDIVSRSTRDALLFTLPNSVLVGLGRLNDASADVTKMLTTTEQWGLLSDGRWATDILLRNAVRATRGMRLEGEFERFRKKFEVGTLDDTVDAQLEIVTGEVDWIMPSLFLSRGAERARAVARLTVPRYSGGNPDMAGTGHRSGVGTGWMIAPNLLITNLHVVDARFKLDPLPAPSKEDRHAQAEAILAWFGYVEDLESKYSEYSTTKLEASSPVLDYAVLRMSPHDKKCDVPLADWGHLSLERPEYCPELGDPLNIIQHPGGDPQRVALRRNDFIRDVQTNGRFLYLTDTRPGSSGSPIFDDDWLVVGLHRASTHAKSPAQTVKGEKIKYNNQGVWIREVIADLPKELRFEIAQHQTNYS